MADDEEGGATYPKDEHEFALGNMDSVLGLKVFKFCASSCGLFKSVTLPEVVSQEQTCLGSFY